jgi:signal transduction histidine kinase
MAIGAPSLFSRRPARDTTRRRPASESASGAANVTVRGRSAGYTPASMRTKRAVGQGRTTPFVSARPGVEKMLATTFFAVRGVHVIQGLTCLASGRRAYRRPALATATEAAAILELGMLAWRHAHSGQYDSTAARADAAFGLVGLVAMAAATEPADRTASLNWMLPLTVGSTLGSAVLETVTEGAVTSAVLGATYALTTAGAIREGGGRGATAAANALSYPGFFVVATLVVRLARRMAAEVDQARHDAVEQGARLAAEAATNREHRLLHDSALQTLEAIASGAVTDPAVVRRHAEREAAALRYALSGGLAAPGGVVARLAKLSEELADRGLRVELVADDLESEPCGGIADALCEATREALANVVKHAGVDRTIVRVTDDDGSWRVTVRDRGVGFDPEKERRGYGLEHSIAERLTEVGGFCRVTSSPGQGTKVELWVPA